MSLKGPDFKIHYETQKETKEFDPKQGLANIRAEIEKTFESAKSMPDISDKDFTKKIPNKKEAKKIEYSLNQLDKQKAKEIQETVINPTKVALEELKQQILQQNPDFQLIV